MCLPSNAAQQRQTVRAQLAVQAQHSTECLVEGAAGDLRAVATMLSKAFTLVIPMYLGCRIPEHCAGINLTKKYQIKVFF